MRQRRKERCCCFAGVLDQDGTVESHQLAFQVSGEEPLLHQDERSHGFYDRDSSRNDAWVMAATSGQGA